MWKHLVQCLHIIGVQKNVLDEVIMIIDSILCSGFLANLNGQFKGLKSGI